MRKNTINVIADDREHAIIKNAPDIMREYFAQNNIQSQVDIKFDVERLKIGDFAIMEKQEIKIIIERKTLRDYAASLKDGRHLNKQKLIDLRNEIGCAIFYIVEGPAFPAITKKFSRTPYRNIESSIFHLMLRDNIFVVKTPNAKGTIELILRLVLSLNSLEKNDKININKMNGANSSGEQMKLLKGGIENTMAEKIKRLYRIWSVFRGITSTTAKMFARDFSIYDLLKQRINFDVIRYPNNRKITRRLIAEIQKPVFEYQIKLLAKVPRIGKNKSEKILDNIGTLEKLLELPENEIAKLEIAPQKKIGKKTAASIILFLKSSEKELCDDH